MLSGREPMAGDGGELGEEEEERAVAGWVVGC